MADKLIGKFQSHPLKIRQRGVVVTAQDGKCIFAERFTYGVVPDEVAVAFSAIAPCMACGPGDDDPEFFDKVTVLVGERLRATSFSSSDGDGSTKVSHAKVSKAMSRLAQCELDAMRHVDTLGSLVMEGIFCTFV